jgi:hypothetical protein
LTNWKEAKMEVLQANWCVWKHGKDL